jgi:hypothetical protein
MEAPPISGPSAIRGFEESSNTVEVATNVIEIFTKALIQEDEDTLEPLSRRIAEVYSCNPTIIEQLEKVRELVKKTRKNTLKKGVELSLLPIQNLYREIDQVKRIDSIKSHTAFLYNKEVINAFFVDEYKVYITYSTYEDEVWIQINYFTRRPTLYAFLNRFPHLNICLNIYEFDTEVLNRFINTFGHRIKEFYFVGVEAISDEQIEQFISKCPNIIDLHVRTKKKVIKGKFPKIDHLIHLKRLRITGDFDLSNLKSISRLECLWFYHRTSIPALEPFVHLKEVYFELCTFDEKTKKYISEFICHYISRNPQYGLRIAKQNSSMVNYNQLAEVLSQQGFFFDVDYFIDRFHPSLEFIPVYRKLFKEFPEIYSEMFWAHKSLRVFLEWSCRDDTTLIPPINVSGCIQDLISPRHIEDISKEELIIRMDSPEKWVILLHLAAKPKNKSFFTHKFPIDELIERVDDVLEHHIFHLEEDAILKI